MLPRYSLWFSRLLAVTTVCTIACAADIPAQLTLPQALNLALTNSTVIREAMAQLDQTSGRYLQSRSVLLPHLDFGARQAIETISLQGAGVDIPGLPASAQQGKVGPFGSMDVRLALSQDLFNLASIRAWQSYRSRRESSRLLVDDAREIVALNVVSSYLEAIRSKATRDTLAEQQKLAEELYKITRERVTQGVAAELDANRAMQKVNTLEQQWQQASQRYIVAKLNLANILQVHITSDFEIADSSADGSAVLLERSAAIAAALAARADYRSAESQVRAAELQVKSVKASRLPTLALRVGDGQSGNSPLNNVNTYRVQGQIDVPIYTGGRIKGEIEEAEGALRQAQTQLDKNRLQIETDVLTAITGIEWALKQVETSARNTKLSRQEVEFTRARFAQGISDNTEVVNAQDRLTQADEAEIEAGYLLGLARANLARATGTAEKTYRK
jgi:outer membrane protein TolC